MTASEVGTRVVVEVVLDHKLQVPLRGWPGNEGLGRSKTLLFSSDGTYFPAIDNAACGTASCAIMASLNSKKVDYASPTSRDTFRPCHYSRSMKANPLDDGIGDTLVSPAFDDVTLISHGKRVNLRTRIKELNLEPEAYARMMSGKAQFRVVLTM
jgi:hypothetical protein